MAETTHIEWTDATWNPVTGCSMVSAGCTNCYAQTLAGTRLRDHPSRAGLTRLSGGRHVWTGEVRLNENWLDQPLRWRRPRRIFVCAHGDLFHERVPDAWIDRVFAVMALAPQHTFQVLTKRPERMREYLGGDRFAESHATERIGYAAMTMIDEATGGDETKAPPWPVDHSIISSLLHGPTPPIPSVCWPRREVWPLPNVWLGTSIEDQTTANERIPHLLDIPAAVRFISAEPLLGPVDLETAWHGETALDAACWGACGWCANGHPPLHDCRLGKGSGDRSGLDWVICGGESGPGARPMHPEWARSLRDQCEAAGVPFFFKQWGDWAPWDDDNWSLPAGCDDVGAHERAVAKDGCEFLRVGKGTAGRQLDGRTHDDFPEAAR